jgi:hypothetical protein
MMSPPFPSIGRWQTGRSTQHNRAAGRHARLPNSQDATTGAGRDLRSAGAVFPLGHPFARAAGRPVPLRVRPRATKAGEEQSPAARAFRRADHVLGPRTDRFATS